MARTKEKTIWQVLSAKNPESITLEEVKNAMRGVNPNNTSYSGKGTPLCYAVRTGRMDIIRYFVEELKVNVAIPQDNTPLQVALKNGNMELVKYFFELDPLVGGREYQADCICAAISGKQFDMLKFLVEEKKFFVGDKNNDEPLRAATWQGGWQFFKYLIKHGAIPTNKILETTIAQPEPLLPILKDLLEQPKIKYNLYNAVKTAISHNRSLECIKYLFSKGGSIKTEEDEYGNRTPLLFFAVEENNIENVKFLISQGADIREKDDEQKTILEYIWWNDENLPILQYLVEELNYFDGLEKDCSLCRFKTPAPLKFLVGYGLTYRQKKIRYNRNNFFSAVVEGNLSLVKYLVEELNFSIDPKDDAEEPVLLAMEYSLEEANYENFLYLIEKSTSINAEDDSGNSVLDIVLRRCSCGSRFHGIDLEKQKHIIKLLLKKGAQSRRAGDSKSMELLNECVAELQKELPPEQMPTITLAMLEKATGGFLHDDLEKIQSLLDQGLQIPQEIEEMSTLGFIAQKHKDNILKYFVEEKKFDVNYQDSEGRSPLIYLLINAIPWGMNMECFSYLLDQKADVNCEDKNGISVLQYACLCHVDKLEIIKTLIRHGAEYQALLDKGNRFIAQALKEIEQEKSASEK